MKNLQPDDKRIVKAISELPVSGEFKEQEIISIILEKCKNLKVHNKTIYIYRNNYYAKFKDIHTTKSWFLASIITHIKGSRATSQEINTIYQELISQYFKFEEFKDDETALNVKNGIVVFGKKGVRFEKHDPKYFFPYKQPFDYDKDAEAPLFDKVIDAAFNDDEDIVLAFQEYLGYIFMKKQVLNLEKLCILYGSGANGKSVILDTISYLINEVNISRVELKNFNKENNLAAMDSKLLNIGSDASSKNVATDTLKKIISGEAIEAKKLYNDVSTIENLPKLMIALNQMPDASHGDFSYGYLRRLMIFPFKNIIPEDERDPHLLNKLKKEMSGILNFVIIGYEALLEQKEFTQSELLDEALQDYKLELDHIQYFFDEQTIIEEEDSRITNEVLYKIYTQWCKDSGIRHLSKIQLLKSIRSLNRYKEYKNDAIKGWRFEFVTKRPTRKISTKKTPAQMDDDEIFN